MPMETNRAWDPRWGELNVTVQKGITLKSIVRGEGFTDPRLVYVPYDTLPLLAKWHPDAVISGELGARTLFSALHRRCHGSSRLVIWATLSERTEQGRGRLRNLARGWLLRQADAVLVNGASGRRYVRRFVSDPNRINEVPYAPNLDLFGSVPAKRPGDLAHILLYVGQLVERKGLAPFVRVAARWAELHPSRCLEFWFAGSGPLVKTLEAIPHPTSLSLRFVGEIPYSELPQVYAKAGILVLPTLADEWGVVVNEAMAAGLPVLGSVHSQAVEEMVREGINGWTFAPDDPESAFRALERALDTPAAVLDGMRAAARSTAATITPEDMAERIARTIERCFEAE